MTRAIQDVNGAAKLACHPRRIHVFMLLLWAIASGSVCNAANPVAPPVARLGPEEMAVVINDLDPLSKKIGMYYQEQRRIPTTNIIHVRFQPGHSNMARKEFDQLKADIDGKTPANIQAYALTWIAPYRVDCMSITTAFAAGFDTKFCSTNCSTTKLSPYFNSNSKAPWTDYKIRPSMVIAGSNFAEAKKLIDRGVASDGTLPKGFGYLVSTTDTARNVRAVFYSEIVKFLGRYMDFRIIEADYLVDRRNIMFYFTGSVYVHKLKTNHFLPGAIADHLTSSGGQLTDSSQMSSLRWLEAGATGSYGTVVEPCNHLAKFPHPGIVISHYLQGATLIEAYWKGVAWPGEGIFIGEPLARPFALRN